VKSNLNVVRTHALLVRLKNGRLLRRAAVIFLDCHSVDLKDAAALQDLINVGSYIFFCRFLKFNFILLFILFLGCNLCAGHHFLFLFDLGLLDHCYENRSDVAELSSQDSLLDILVETILYLVIVTSFDKAGHLFPLAAILLVQFDEFDVFLLRPLILDDFRVSLVQPALTALPRQATGHLVGDVLPLDHLVWVAQDGLSEHLILSLRPSNFVDLYLVCQLQVPVVTFDHRFKHILADQSPLVHAVLSHQVQELLVLVLVPDGQLPRVVALGRSLANSLRNGSNVAVASCSCVLFIINCLHLANIPRFKSFSILI